MRTHQRQLRVSTRGRGLRELTAEVAAEVQGSGVVTGMAHLFVHHTSASLIVCENADPSVLVDLEAFFARLVPDGDRLFIHTAEGPDDMPAHVRSVLTATTLSVPVVDGRLALGTWQGLFLYEHRQSPHARRLTVTVQG